MGASRRRGTATAETPRERPAVVVERKMARAWAARIEGGLSGILGIWVEGRGVWSCRSGAGGLRVPFAVNASTVQFET